MHRSLGLGTVPLDVMGRDRQRQTKKTFLESVIEHPKIWEVGGRRRAHQTEEKLALR